VVFCDLVGSTELSHHLDPEESRAIVLPYQRAAARVVEQFGGHVAKFLGDGVMALFGWPQAHEDDAERAVRAALSILEAISALNRESQGPRLSARIGIHTGEAVVAAGGDEAPDVFGDASNFASRVQNAADSNTVVVTAQTHQLVAGRFVVESLGNKDLKGIDEPVELFRVIRPSGARGHLASAAVRGLTPFVGREDELRTLMSRWERAREGEGQVVLISGEAGIGKSRLVQQFRERLAATPHSWIKCELSPYLQNTPFASVADMFQQGLDWGNDDSVETKLAQLEQNLERVGLQPAEALPLLAPLLSLTVPQKYQPLQPSPEQQRKRLLATLTGWLFGMARVHPVVMVLEDLQWSDPSTLEFHQTSVEQGATVPLLLLYTTRPEFRAPWPMHAHHAQITLGRLRERDVREMVHAVAPRVAMTEQMVDAVTSRSSGVPLFVEELTREVVESGGRGATEDIPETLHNSLVARLDRLGPAREVAQVASVIGREFSYQLLGAISQVGEGELQSALNQLADAELVYARGVPPAATYQFKHALIRDAAYDALLKTRRRELHRRVAQVLTGKFSALADAQPALVAQHWAEGGETERATDAWEAAARSSAERGALREAEFSLRSALTNLKNLPESASRDFRELDLLMKVVPLVWTNQGFGGEQLRELNERCRVLAERTGELSSLITHAYASWTTTIATGQYAACAGFADILIDIAKKEGSDLSLSLAYEAKLEVRTYRGDLLGSEEDFASGNSLFGLPGFQQTTGAVDRVFFQASLNAWLLGLADTARQRFVHSIATAPQRSSFDHAHAKSNAAALNVLLREPQKVAAFAAQAVEISEEHGYPEIAAWSRAALGWAKAQLGAAREGVALLRQYTRFARATGQRIFVTAYLTWLAEAQGMCGSLVDALRTTELALRTNREEVFFQPETIRVRGELHLRQHAPGMAEEDFRHAIALSQSMSAKLLELRATTSLALLLRDTDRRDEARAMLAEIYNWFTEGFDTADLKDAKALLDELDRIGLPSS
jgi:class 3 adenylate cyclase